MTTNSLEPLAYSCHKISLLLTFSLFFVIPNNAGAFYPSDSDLKFLPPYCKARLRSKQVPAAEVEKWKNFIGRETWASFHHYCQGINYVMYGERTMDQKKKADYYKRGIKNLVFHLQTYGPSFRLRPQTYLLLGTAYKGLKDIRSAIEALSSAIEANPKYVAAYRSLADIYLDTGDLQAASDIVEKGLSQSPESKSLLKRKRLIESRTGKE